MQSVPPSLASLEAEVMAEIWEQGEVPVRAVMEALNRRAKSQRAYTTIMTVMARLDEKGFLSRRREGKTDLYSPVMTYEEYQQARAQSEVGALVDEFGDVALAHFAQQMERLDPKRRAQLRRLARGK